MKPAIGSINWKIDGKTHYGIVTELQESHGDDYFIRYQTDAMFNFMEPLIKYNHAKQRVYFLTDRSANGDITFPEFETKGYKAEVWFKGLE